MIHYLFSFGFWISCMGLPLLAKDTTSSLHPPSSSKGNSTSTLATSNSPAKKENEKTSVARKDTRTSSATTSTSTSKNHETSGLVAKASPTPSSSSAKKETASHIDTASNERLARVTAYWAGEGDYYTSHGLSSTGIRLHEGHCAVDPRVIPYGSVVKIAGVGSYVAVDTGSAVISREAAREIGHTSEERNALVIDLFFESRRDGEHFAANGPKFASITWETPRSANNEPKDKRNLYAEESLDKIRNSQL
jgi:3D (Asp-Asp-Asp) domain-containing protein